MERRKFIRNIGVSIFFRPGNNDMLISLSTFLKPAQEIQAGQVMKNIISKVSDYLNVDYSVLKDSLIYKLYQMKNLLIKLILSTTFVTSVFLSPFTSNGQTYDKELAKKYDLRILPEDNYLEPAPEWFQNADMITSGRNIWKGHEFKLIDTLMTRIVRVRAGNNPVEITEHYPVEYIDSLDGSAAKGIPLLSHVPHSKKTFQEAHKKGFKAIPYVHFRCIHTYFSDQDVFYFEHPEILLKDKDGNWVNIPMDGSRRLHRFLTCANSPSYWNLSLAYIKKMMDWGADGIFIDNLERRDPCLADRFTTRNPEFKPYVHEHLFPNATHDYAWDRMLQAIRQLVKSYGEDKIVILNSGIGTDFQKNGDACMWESFIYSRAWEGRRHTWEEVKQKAKDNAWFLEAGRGITALSTINPAREESKDDAFWAFSAARLVDFIWWASLNGTGAEILQNAHLGKGLEPVNETNGIAYRNYENGIIALNNSLEDMDITIPLKDGTKGTYLVDLYNDSGMIRVKNREVKVFIPKQSARVYMHP
ncbi:MAG: hypothetical protein PHH93_09530 [Prolixibacteraceae bacterium]|nr:hypothetical protein [Prolixibacteraceae bacterium]